MARINAVLNRRAPAAAGKQENEIYTIGHYSFDPKNQKLTINKNKDRLIFDAWSNLSKSFCESKNWQYMSL